MAELSGGAHRGGCQYLVTTLSRDVGWLSRLRRLARDQERLAEVLQVCHLVAFTMLMWKQVLPVLGIL